VVVLQVPDEVLLQRVLGRRMDPVTGKIYHVEFDPVPEGEDEIANRLVTREDDTEEKFRTRIAAFHENKDKLLEAYPDACVLDGNRPPDEIWKDVEAHLAAP
jgi:adenylate kinase